MPFQSVICPNGNIVVRVEFELTDYDVTVVYVNNNTMRIP